MRSLKIGSLLAAVALAGCSPKVASIDVQPAQVTLTQKGDVAKLVATPKDANGNKVEKVTLQFASSDAAVATVDAATGAVTAVKTGDAKIKVSFEQITAEVPVVVTIPASISLAPTELKLGAAGEKAAVTAKVVDEKGREVAVDVAWESGAPEVASVAKGEVTAVAAGTAQVFAVAAGIRAPVTVTVAPPAPAAVELANAAMELKAGETAKLAPVAKDAAGQAMAGAAFTYSSADAAVATVADDGTVTAVAKGKTTLTAAAGDKSATVEITVK